MRCAEVDAAISARIEDDEKLTLANGKLLERLLVLKMLREGIPVSEEEIMRGWHDWDWENHPEGPGDKHCQDLTIAPFIDRLIDIAEVKISNIRYLVARSYCIKFIACNTYIFVIYLNKCCLNQI